MTDPLTTLPPELLLTILSHLPSPSLLPLTQTCTYLRGFIHIHSASICNTFITSSPLYSRAASILQASTSATGWILPNHRCVQAAEVRMVRDRILFSGCSCFGCRQLLRSSMSVSSEVSLPEQEGWGRMLCFPTTIPGRCKAGFDAGGVMKLSEPGPQFLIFLEKYSWEIVTRWDMTSSRTTLTNADDVVEQLSTIHEVEEDSEDIANEAEKQREQQRRKDEEVFSFMVGNYCVRRFLEDVEGGFEKINNPVEHEAVIPKKPMTERIKTGFGMLKSCLGKRKKNAGKKESAPRMMFGEIPSDENVPALNEKRKPVEDWMKGLVWYYGVSTNVPLVKEIDRVEGKGLQRCVGNMRSELSKAGMKVRMVWRKFGRGSKVDEGMGEFQSLDD